MITLHRLNNQEFVLNADLIETLEATPDTLLTMTNGKKLLVRDTILDIIGRVINYRQLCHSAIQVVQTQKMEPADGSVSTVDAAGPDKVTKGKPEQKGKVK